MTREEIKWWIDRGVEPVEWIHQLSEQLDHIIKTDCRAMMIIDKTGNSEFINYPTKEDLEKALE